MKMKNCHLTWKTYVPPTTASIFTLNRKEFIPIAHWKDNLKKEEKKAVYHNIMYGVCLCTTVFRKVILTFSSGELESYSEMVTLTTGAATVIDSP